MKNFNNFKSNKLDCWLKIKLSYKKIKGNRKIYWHF